MKRDLYVCEMGHIIRSIVKPKIARVCRHCGVIVPDKRHCPKGMAQARRLSELTLSFMTPSQIKASKLMGTEQVFTKGAIRRVRSERPLILDFSDRPRQRGLLE